MKEKKWAGSVLAYFPIKSDQMLQTNDHIDLTPGEDGIALLIKTDRQSNFVFQDIDEDGYGIVRIFY